MLGRLQLLVNGGGSARSWFTSFFAFRTGLMVLPLRPTVGGRSLCSTELVTSRWRSVSSTYSSVPRTTVLTTSSTVVPLSGRAKVEWDETVKSLVPLWCYYLIERINSRLVGRVLLVDISLAPGFGLGELSFSAFFLTTGTSVLLVGLHPPSTQFDTNVGFLR